MLGAARLARAGLLLLACLCVLACQALVGDFDVSGVDQGCDQNRYRCMGELLYCVRTVDGKDEPTLIKKCNSAAECDSAGGQCTVCKKDEFRCNGARLERCSADRTSWTLHAACASAAECNVGSAECRACVPGEVQCSGAEQRDLQICNEDHQWGDAGSCDTEELCERSAQAAREDPSSAACIPAGCPEEGAYRCADDVELERCPVGRIGWERTDVCASSELCSATADTPGLADSLGMRCKAPTCSSQQFRCVGNRLEQCNSDLQGWGLAEECEPPFVCDLNDRACAGPCTPGENQCNGAVLEVCNDRQEWEPFETCASEALCSVTEDDSGLFFGACQSPGCDVALQYRCSEAEVEGVNRGVLEQCRADRTGWEPIDVCASFALCSEADGACAMPGCEPAGAYRCNPAQPLELQICPPELTGWETDRVCASTQACDPSGGCSDTCPAISVRCMGNVRQVCSGATGVPVWSPESTCPTAELCQCALDPNDANECIGGLDAAGRCGQPACGGTLPSSRCTGDFLETCDPMRNRWNQTECTIECVQPDTGASYCAQCREGEAQCAGMGLRRCNAETGLFDPASACSIACVNNSGNNDYCADCAAGSAECQDEGTTVRTCNATTQRWNSATQCPLGCVEASGPDYCAQCAAGAAECVDGKLRTCNATTLTWNELEECDLGCVEASGPDYCAECTADDEATCVSGGLRTCNVATGRFTTEPCTIACVEVAGPDHCAECTATDAVCVTGGLQTCDMTTRRWNDPEPCLVLCFDAGTGPDYCGDCTPGSSECPTADTRRTCSEAARWNDAETCDFGCFAAGSSTYCGECSVPEDCPTASASCVMGLCEDP